MTILLALRCGEGIVLASDTLASSVFSVLQARYPNLFTYKQWRADLEKEGALFSDDGDVAFTFGAQKMRASECQTYGFAVAGFCADVDIIDSHYSQYTSYEVISELRTGRSLYPHTTTHIVATQHQELFLCHGGQTITIDNGMTKYDHYGYLDLPDTTLSEQSLMELDRIAEDAFKKLEIDHLHDGFGGFDRLHITPSGIHRPLPYSYNF